MKSQQTLIFALVGALAFGAWQWQKNQSRPSWAWEGVPGDFQQYEPAAVPVTLPDGRQAYLLVQPPSDAYRPAAHPAVYSRPVSEPVRERVIYTSSPVVERQVIHQPAAQPAQEKGRSWEREVLIVAGSAGAGTAIGAIAGGRKGAAVGAVSGGVAGLIYDLATRNKNKDGDQR
ncbi:MAG TPA: glycine zipper family protein [Acidobacteriota bacterium]|nr:glycine zipper family protein [Acidobacteriota bacterium]